MQIKRVVTAVDDGKSVIQEDQVLTPVTGDIMPGTEIYPLWGTEGPVPPFGEKGAEGATTPFFPGPGGTRFGIFTFPPEERDAPPAEPPAPEVLEALAADLEGNLPGVLGIFEPDNPGFHQTATVDYSIVVQGTLTLEVDDGAEAELPTGSCVVQRGTRHAWHSYGGETAALAYVIVASS
jgi:quercetin dioxygenase-like cupin family protein